MTDRAQDEFDALYEGIGRRIAFVRQSRQRTQTQLATAVGLQRTSISNVEAGRQRPGVHVLMLIAAYLETSVTELLGLDSGSGGGLLPVLDGALIEQMRRAAHAEGWHDCAKAMRVAASAVTYPGNPDA